MLRQGQFVIVGCLIQSTKRVVVRISHSVSSFDTVLSLSRATISGTCKAKQGVSSNVYCWWRLHDIEENSSTRVFYRKKSTEFFCISSCRYQLICSPQSAMAKYLVVRIVLFFTIEFSNSSREALSGAYPTRNSDLRDVFVLRRNRWNLFFNSQSSHSLYYGANHVASFFFLRSLLLASCIGWLSLIANGEKVCLNKIKPLKNVNRNSFQNVHLHLR
jgi:hypothetical protein